MVSLGLMGSVIETVALSSKKYYHEILMKNP